MVFRGKFGCAAQPEAFSHESVWERSQSYAKNFKFQTPLPYFFRKKHLPVNTRGCRVTGWQRTPSGIQIL